MRVLVRNWRQGKDEIDLVCEDRGVLVLLKSRLAADLLVVDIIP